MQILDDLKYSLRLLRKTPGFTVVTLIVMVSGLSLFLAAYAIAIAFNKPLPFPDGNRFVSFRSIVQGTSFASGIGNHDFYTYNSLSDASDNYEVLGVFSQSQFNLSDGDYAQRYSGARITPNLLNATTVNPILGRLFTADDATDSSRVVLISYELWQNYYGGDANIVGRTSRIGDQPFTIIGVMPESFQFPRREDLWFPLSVPASAIPGEGPPLSIVGFLKPDTSLNDVQVEFDSITDRLVSEYPEIYPDRIELVSPYELISQPSTSRVTDLDFIVMLTTLIILALTVINLSSLLLIRSSSRNQELALRSAVGGNRAQLVKQVLIESFIICVFGLMLSLIISVVLIDVLRAQYFYFGSTTMGSTLEMNFQVIFAGGMAASFIWLASGMQVAYKAYSSQPGNVLTSAGKGSSKPSVGQAFRFTVLLEVVLSCFLLVFCGYLLGFINDFRRLDFGVPIENAVVANVSLNGGRFEGVETRTGYLRDLQQQLSTIAGIEGVAFTSELPGQPGESGTYSIEEADLEVQNQFPPQTTIWVSENYFNIAGVDILEGRDFSTGDTMDSENVVIVSDSLARQLWPNTSALGKRIRSLNNQQEQWLQVVGVISPILQFPVPIGTAAPALYRPLSQGGGSEYFILARHDSSIAGSDLREPILVAATTADRDIPLENVRSLEEEMSLYMGDIPVTGTIFQAFALATLVVASIGIYGVIARSIFVRTHEIGVRRALGSSNFKIIRRFIRQGFTYLLMGTLVGAVPAILLLLFTNSTVDYQGNNYIPTIFALVVTALATIICVACYLPARKAVAMEPGDALRYE